MLTAYIQLGANCSSPSICPARATGWPKMATWTPKNTAASSATGKRLSTQRFFLVVRVAMSSSATAAAKSINGSSDDLDHITMSSLHPLSRQARQVRPFCMDPECQLTWTPVPNMGAALTGYNHHRQLPLWRPA